MYVAQSRFPKWLGIALGGMFAVIFAGTSVIILQLTRATAPVAVAAAPAVAPAPAPVAAVAPAAAPEAVAAPTAAPASDEAAPVAKTAKRHRAKAHVAKRSTGISEAKAKAILARHDTKAKAKQRDAIDKLLGL
jgi:hypothetical protein